MAMHHTAIFVFVVIIGCNLVLYPSLFSKLFRQWFGGGEEVKPKAHNLFEDVPPPMRGRPHSFQGPASVQHRQGAGSERNPFPSSSKGQEPGYKGVMGTVLPVYAVGIMIYFVFVIYKVFLKEKPSKDPLTGKTIRGRVPQNSMSMDRRLRVEEEILQQRLSEELRKHGYGKANPTDPAAPSETSTSAKSNSDAEVAVLQSRLAQTERTMAKMLEMMNNMGISVSEMSSQLGKCEDSGQSEVNEHENTKEELIDDEEGESEIEASDNEVSSDEYGEDEIDEDEDDVDDDDDETAPCEVEDIGAIESNEETDGTVRRRNVKSQE